MGLEEKVRKVGDVVSVGVVGTGIVATVAAVVASFGVGAYIGYTGGSQGDYSVPPQSFPYMVGSGLILPAAIVAGEVVGGITSRVSDGGFQHEASDLMGGVACVMAAPAIWGAEMIAYGVGFGVGLIAGHIA